MAAKSNERDEVRSITVITGPGDCLKDDPLFRFAIRENVAAGGRCE